MSGAAASRCGGRFPHRGVFECAFAGARLRSRGALAHLEQALDLARDATLDGAILDINLDGKLCFPIAAMLSQRGVPYFFVTGYSEDIVPAKYQSIPLLEKPFEDAELKQMLLREFLHAA